MTCLNSIRWILLGTLCLASPSWLHAQVITSFTPHYGSTGDSMTINGSGFATGIIEVNFWNGVPLTDAFITSDSVIAVNSVPAGISTGPLSVRRDGGPWNYSADIFTDVGPGPFIEKVLPAYGTVNDSIQIHGVHFIPGSVVQFSGVTAFSQPNDAGTLLTAFVPAGAPSNSVITVTSTAGAYTNPEPFTVVGAGPFIANFAPDAGSDTQPVTLVGLHFAGTSSVEFNGQGAGFTPPTSDTTLMTAAPAGVTTGPITITTPSGSYTTPTPFYGPIRLTGFTPTNGPTASEVLITGTNFTDATSVKFGGFTGVEASFVVSNNNEIVATVPDDAPTGILVVATPAGSFPTTSNFVVTPSITDFTPKSGSAGTPVLITGTRLVDNSGEAPTVKFEGVNATVTSWDAQQVIANAPAAASGFITLTTTDGTSTTASPFYYPPQITGFTPNADPPGTVVTVTGQSLTNASSVLFNGVPSANVFNNNNNTLMATVPTGITTGPITVTTPGGAANSSPLLYYAAPVIAAFAPNSGGPGTSVTVFGSSFQGAISVSFNGTKASFNNVSGSQLTAVVPTGASTGPISVTAPAGTATSAESFVVPQVSDLRVNTFLHDPEPVTVGEDLTLTIVPANNGPNTATNVTASVMVAPGLTVKSASFQPPVLGVNTNGNPVVFDIGTMTKFDNPALTLVLVPQVDGPATNTVTLSSATFDPDPGNNTDLRVSTVLPIPELSIDRAETNQVRVAWPASLAGYTLQSTPDLSTNSPWANVPGTPTLEGSEQVVTEPSTGATKFYRLKN